MYSRDRGIIRVGWGGLLAGLLLLAAAQPAAAELVTVYFSGSITVADPYHMLPGEIASGNSFLATLTYDSTAPVEPDTFGDVGQQYFGSDFGFSLITGGQVFAPLGTSQSHLSFVDDAPTGDSVLLSMHDFSLPALNSRNLQGSDFFESVFLSLYDPSGQLFSLDHLADGLTYHPGQSLDFQLSAYVPMATGFWPPRPPRGFSILGHIDNIYTLPGGGSVPALASPVPEPSSLALLACALAGLAALRLRRSQ